MLVAAGTGAEEVAELVVASTEPGGRSGALEAAHALSGEKPLAELSSEFGVHPTMISTWKQELMERASELFVTDLTAPLADQVGGLRVISTLAVPSGRR